MFILRSLFSIIFLLASLAAGTIGYNYLFLFEKKVTASIAGMEINSGYLAAAIAVILYVIALLLFPLGRLRKKSTPHSKETTKEKLASEQ